MSKEVQPKKPRSTKKVTGSSTAELEAKIAELEAKLSNLSSQVEPSTRPAQTSAPPPAPKPAPRPAASGPTHGTLPAGMKPEPTPEPTSTASTPSAGEVAPAYAKISSTGYTGNKYFATRKRLSYHPADKQFTGTSTTTTTAPSPASSYSEPEPQISHETSHADVKPQEKKSMWKAKGAEVAESYNPEGHTAPPPAPKPAPRPAASGPTHGTLPAGMKPAPKPEPTPEPTSTASTPSAGEVAPAYAKISSTGYTGNKYFATRKRLSYHPADKQFTGTSTTTTAQTAAEPPKPKSTFRSTLPAGFKP